MVLYYAVHVAHEHDYSVCLLHCRAWTFLPAFFSFSFWCTAAVACFCFVCPFGEVRGIIYFSRCSAPSRGQEEPPFPRIGCLFVCFVVADCGRSVFWRWWEESILDNSILESLLDEVSWKLSWKSLLEIILESILEIISESLLESILESILDGMVELFELKIRFCGVYPLRTVSWKVSWRVSRKVFWNVSWKLRSNHLGSRFGFAALNPVRTAPAFTVRRGQIYWDFDWASFFSSKTDLR